jgi:hypothetical protein
MLGGRLEDGIFFPKLGNRTALALTTLSLSATYSHIIWRPRCICTCANGNDNGNPDHTTL